MKGLPQAMQSILVGHDFLTLKELINKASLVEIDLKQIALEKEVLHNEKRKMPQPNPQYLSSQRLRVGDMKLHGPPPQQAQGQLYHPPQGTIYQYLVESIPQPCAEKPAKCTKRKKKKKKKKKVIVVCHTCHRIGHKTQVCHQRQQFAQLGPLKSWSPPTRSDMQKSFSLSQWIFEKIAGLPYHPEIMEDLIISQ